MYLPRQWPWIFSRLVISRLHLKTRTNAYTTGFLFDFFSPSRPRHWFKTVFAATSSRPTDTDSPLVLLDCVSMARTRKENAEKKIIIIKIAEKNSKRKRQKKDLRFRFFYSLCPFLVLSSTFRLASRPLLRFDPQARLPLLPASTGFTSISTGTDYFVGQSFHNPTHLRRRGGGMKARSIPVR